jgi:iron complex outermembrane recepter protein
MKFELRKSARKMRRGLAAVVCLLAAAGLLAPAAAETRQTGQQGAPVQGRLYNALSGEPIPAASVTIEELRHETQAGRDGSFRFEDVPPGTYHVLITAQGYVPQRVEIMVAEDEVVQDIAVTPELHFTEVVSVSPQPRDQFEAYQPTAVLAGQELTIELESTLGATLERQEGVAQRSFGQAASRPVIRGLDGDRILILENSQRTGDLSNQSGDHGVTVNPAAAQRIEVVRGPATLMYGANAIGGLVNVITEVIPTRPFTGIQGSFLADLGSAADEAGGAGDFLWGNGEFAVRVGGGGRRAGEMGTPLGEIHNTQMRNGLGNAGVAWTRENGYMGVSYGYDDMRYGIPAIFEEEDDDDHDDGHVHEDVELTPRRHIVNFRAEGRNFTGPISSVRATVGIRRYRHEELENGDVHAAFRNNTSEFEVMAHQREDGRLRGAVGVWGMGRAFSVTGEELSPPIDQRNVAVFTYQEFVWPHFTFQFGGRVEHARFRPARLEPARDFTNFSGSVGMLYRPTDASTIAVSLARGARNPALEELYFFGEHQGNFAFEIGNPDLESERALGFDVSYRWRHHRASGEVTYFRNNIDNFIFREPVHDVDDSGPHDHTHDEIQSRLPVIEFIGADSRLQGFEAHADLVLTPQVIAQVGMDYVRGELRTTNEPLPRMPPLRFRGGLRYRWNALQAGGEIVSAARQSRLFETESETPGYNLLRLFGSYSFPTGRSVSTITARLDNATNVLYRNHLSLIKDFVPEVGRNFKVIYGVRF